MQQLFHEQIFNTTDAINIAGVGGPGALLKGYHVYNVPRTYGQALPLIPFSIPIIEHHVQIAVRAFIDCLGQWFLNFFELGIGR